MMKKLTKQIRKLKSKVNEFFLMSNSLNRLMKFLKRFYVISVTLEDIYDGIKNPK